MLSNLFKCFQGDDPALYKTLTLFLEGFKKTYKRKRARSIVRAVFSQAPFNSLQ